MPEVERLAPLLSIAQQIRTHYVGGLLRSFESLRAEQTLPAMEILLELSREGPRAFRLFRADMIGTEEGEPRLTEFNAPTHLSFPPMAWEEDGVEFVLSPLTWNDVGIDLAVPDAQAVTQLIEAWAIAWLDVEDAHPVDEQGLQGVIHSVTEPAQAGMWLSFSVDFGSAPVQALSHLLTSLKNAGATRISLSSSSIEEAED